MSVRPQDLKKLRSGPWKGQKLLQPGADKIPDLEERIAEYAERARDTLGIFRQALLVFAEVWMQDAAKAVAVNQDEHTVALGRQGIRDLKKTVREHAQGLASAIQQEFVPETYAELPGAGSGQVKRMIARRFDQGIRRILSTVYPLLAEHGYRRDDHWMEPDDSRPCPFGLELPPDLRDQIARIADALIEVKVCESKIAYYQRQRGKEIASALWDSA